jgi:tetratricopeptide (TPR) repeat protein
MAFWDIFKFRNDALDEVRIAFRQGAIAFEEKRYADVIPLLDKAIKMGPNIAISYYLRANAFLMLKQSDAALRDYSATLDIKSNYTPALYNRGVIYLGKGDFAKAIADFSTAIKFKHNAFAARAGAYLQNGNFDEALVDIEEAIHREPQDARHWAKKAAIDQSLGNLEEAFRSLEQALVIDPNHVYSHNHIAWLMATSEQDKFRNGKRAVEHALKAVAGEQPPHPGCIGTLAAAYAEAGQFDDAVQWATKFLENDPPAKNVEKAKERLELYRQHKPYREKAGEFETVEDNRNA